MRLLAACSLGGAGHLNPLLPLLGAASSSGHQVLVVGPPGLESMVSRAGFSFHAGAEPEEADISPIRERLVTAAPAEATILGNRDLFGGLATSAMLPTMDELCKRWRPDLVLREPCEYASAVVASSMEIPMAQVAISTAAAEQTSIDAAAPVLEGHRRGLVEEITRSPYLTRFPASMDPTAFATTIRYREAPHGVPQGLPDWWHGSRAPLVYMTLGSVVGYMTFATRAFEVLLEAAEQLADARVLLTTGRGVDLSTVARLPLHIHVEAWVDQPGVLASSSVVVCHGGSGTTLGALAAGIPVVVLPWFADQYNNAEHVRHAGAGVMIDLPRRADRSLDFANSPSIASRIAGAVDEVKKIGSFRTSASRLSTELASSMAPAEALDHAVSTFWPS